MKFIITFGQAHVHRMNGHTFDKDSVAVIEAPDEIVARDIARELFNNVYHQSMPESEYDEKGYDKYFPRGKLPANFKE